MRQDLSTQTVAFIGGGNMASAIIGGLLRQGMAPAQIQVVEPLAEPRDRLAALGVRALASPQRLEGAGLAVWAVKPQTFSQAAAEAGPHLPGTLHLSVAAGIRSDSISQWLGSERIVRAMPNTPALIGQGMTALFARPGVTADEQAAVEAVIRTTGDCLWLNQESQLDAVTALSGSGPAYVFFFIEAMTQAGLDMGLSQAQALGLAKATFTGASALAQASAEPPQVLRQRVTSKGGTTHAALSAMEAAQLGPHFVAAIRAAEARARELGDEFGRPPA
jgi:pyrroline-5-carboxylate reductase